MPTELIENLIIGAGPAGLAVAGRLRKLDIPFTLIEKSNKIGFAWHNHYDRLHLHTVKRLSHLPYLPFPEHYPSYVSRLDLIKYFEAYAQKFEINPRFEVEVNVIKKEEKLWKVDTSKGEINAKNVIVATGVNHIPKRPNLKGEENFEGTIEHSKTYKNHIPYKGKKVLVVGFGNTGAEIALDLAEQGIDCAISVRSPVTIVPRDVNGKPVQETAKVLAKLPFGLGDAIGTLVRKIVIGNLSKYGVPQAKIHPAKQLRETGKTPVIDLGTVNFIKQGKIKVHPDISQLSKNEVVFFNGKKKPFDAIILATGYTSNLTKIVENIEPELDNFGYPKSPIALHPSNKGLYFVGFDNYKLGGILGTIYNDSETVVNHLSRNLCY